MPKIKLDIIKVSGLEIVTNTLNLRRDMHVFIDYVEQRDVKRSYRGNNLSKTDATRLAKLMSNPQALEEIKAENYYGTWIDFVDKLALKLGFVNYDTKGEYMGYTSYAPSFRDNYISVLEKPYNDFLKKSLQEQENFLLDSFIKKYNYSNNEFYRGTYFTKLDSFDSHGCAVGVMPNLDFVVVRQFIFNLLKNCQSDVWYSTASLIKYLKTYHKFFLIPKNPKITMREKGRYSNFYEHIGSSWGNRKTISENDKDAFERVEGRYVERFLEGIPLTLGYIEVAYGEKAGSNKKGEQLFPALNKLKAFRLKPHFFHLMNGKIAEPKVTVQPNFEIHVESEFYPIHTLDTLIPIANIVSDDTAIILKLEKKKASEMIADENLDVIELLKRLSGKNLPQNILTELGEWAGQSDIFTLYEGFGLLEGNVKLALVNNFTVEQIAPNLRIVKKPNQLFSELEQAEVVPLKVQHQENVFSTLPKIATTVFRKENTAPKKPTKAKRKQVTLSKQTTVSFYFPDKELLEIFREDLLKLRCPLEVNATKKTISFPQSYEKHLKDTIKRINKEYQIQLKDIN